MRPRSRSGFSFGTAAGSADLGQILAVGRDPARDLRDLLDCVLGKGVTVRPLRPGEAIELPSSQSPEQPSPISIEVECSVPERTLLSAPRRFVAIVGRDRPAVFKALQSRLAEPEHGQVLWDRRTAKRRSGQASIATERRHADRRGSPPTTWAIWGFLMARQDAPDR